MTNTLDPEALARAWGHSVEFVEAQRARDLLRDVLRQDIPVEYNEPALCFALKDGRGPRQGFDLIVRFAHEISTDESLTPDEVTELTRKVANLAISIVQANIMLADASDGHANGADRVYAAVAPKGGFRRPVR